MLTIKLVTRALLCLILLVCFTTFASHSVSAAKPNKEIVENRRKNFQKLVKDGMSYFKQKDFTNAIAKFKTATELEPLDPSVQYYLGLSCVHAQDYKMAEDALCKVVVMSNQTSNFHKNALQCFQSYRKDFNRVRPYSCLLDGSKFFHWSRSSMPVKIFISDGLNLPTKFRGDALSRKNLPALAKQVKDKRFLSSLHKDKHYRDGFDTYARKGLDEWAFANTEGIVKYKLINDPNQASILLFWCSSLKDKKLATTTFTTTLREPIFIQIAVDPLLQSPLQKWPHITQAIAAHEFGHAFGLQNSPSELDLMYPIERLQFAHTGHKQMLPNLVTNSDAATLRALYNLPTQLPK